MPLTKVTPPNLHQTVKTMVTTMVNETAVDSADVVTLINANAIDSADATLIINSNIAAKSTSDLSEGSNLYYTNARADARVNLQTGANLVLSNKSTSDLSEGTNLYYTDARVDARLSGGSVGNIVTTGYLAGPATFTIDPAAVGDNTGTVVIAGSLQVDGTTTTINSTTMTVDDLNLTLASGAANAAAANGAGITVDGSNATITYDGTNDEWDFNKDINVTGAVTADGLTVSQENPKITITDTGTGADHELNGASSIGNLTLNFDKNDEGSSPYFYIQHAGNKLAAFRKGGDISFYEDTGTTAKFFWDASAERLGIGTSSPYTLLELSSIDPILRFNDSNGGTDTKNFELRYVGTNSPDIDGLYFRTVNDANTVYSDKMTILGNGNVGIGTNSPLSGLHISDGTNAGSPQNASRKATLMIDAGATASADLQFMVRNGYNSHIFFGDAADPNVGMLWYDHSTNHMNFSANTNHTMTIDDNGNVGIGETNPENILHIKTGAAGGPQIELDSTSGTANSAFINFDGTSLQLSTQRDMVDGSKRDTAKSWGGINIVGAAAGSYIQLQTSSGNNNAVSTRMTVDKDGNVGIGTTNPGQKLTIEGTADNTNSEVRITATGVASGYLGADSNGFNIGTDTAGLYFKTGVTGGQSVGATGSARMVINSSGNVGIGTVSPARQLSIVDDGTNGQAIMEVIDGTNDNVAGIFLGRANNTNIGGMRYFHSDNSLRFRSNDKDSLVIDNQNDLHVSDTTLGSQLYTQSNAGAGSGGTESNATTGWAVGYTGATIASVGTDNGVAPNTGSYQLKYTGTNNGARVDYGFAVEAGKRYQVTLNSDWHQGSLYALVYVATSASGDNLGAAISPIESLNNTTYAETKLSFGATVTGTVYLSFRMASTSSPQNITYVDNISIKEEGTKSIFAKDQYLAGDLYVNGQIKLANLASDPSAGTTGGMYFNTTSGAVKVYDGSSWDQIQALTPFSTINSRYQPHTQVNTQGAGASKITTYGATAWSEFNSSSSTQFGGHDGHDGNPADYPAYVAVYLGGRHAVNRLNIVVHGNSFGFFELQGSNNAGTGGSYSTGSWTSLPFVTSNNSSNNQNAGGQGSGLSEGTVLTFQYDNNIAYQSYRLWIKDNSIPSESVGTRYQGWATYYWELYRV